MPIYLNLGGVRGESTVPRRSIAKKPVVFPIRGGARKEIDYANE
jgi:hypothetical protein